MTTLVELCVRATERGHGILVSGDQKSCSIIYCSARSVVIRSLENPLKADIYGEHAYPVTVARFSPNGEWVASGDVSGRVRIWAAGAGHVLKYEYQSLSGRIDDLQWSADGERIVVCGDGKGKSFVKAFMWDSGNTVGSFDGHSKRVLSCSFKPSRPFRIATCGEDFLINYYEGPPFRFKASHRDHSNFVNCIRFSPDGTKFISVGSDKKGFLYDGKTGDKIGELSANAGHVGSIYAACWSPDGTKVFTASADKAAKIWDISDTSSPKVSTTFLVSDNGTIEDMQVGCLWLKDYLISISLNGQLNFWSTETATPQRVLSGHMKSITAITLALTDHGTDIYSGSYDGVIIKWRLGMGFLCRYEMKELKNITSLLAVGSELLTCGLNKFQRAALDCENYEVDATDLGEPCKDLDGNADISLVCTETGIHLLKGSAILSKTSINYVATAAALSPDGSEAVAGAIDGKLYVYSVNGDTLAQTAVLERHRGPITAVRYSPDGSMYASGDQNREAVVWDRISREVRMRNMLYHTARIKCIAWSPDSSKVATGSIDTCIYVYTVEKPASARITIKGAHLGGVSALAFKDSHTLISGGDDACVRVWNIL